MGNFDRTRWYYSIFKMDVTIWLSALLAVIALGTPVSASEPRVVCYYTNWSVYRPGTARFNPQNINPYLCTHLIYAFGGFTKENSLKPFDKYQDIEKGGYAKFTGLKTYNKNLKTLLAIGGWNEGSTRFSPMVASRDRRREFVRNAIKFLRQNRFDGLDLDWEYPAFRDGGKPKDKEYYARLVKELREEFDLEAEKTGKPRLLLTMAVPAGIEYIQKGFDVKTLNKYLDWMNLLTYDYHSAFEPAVNHHAPLFPVEEPNEYSVDSELNIDYTIKFYLEQGADADKLVLGIPTYGRSYTLFNPDAVELGSPADGPGEQGDATREKGYLAYYEICESIKQGPKKRSPYSGEDSEEFDDEKVEQPWTVMYPNAAAMGPIAYKGNQWVGYDDEDIVRRKAEYVAENRLGGIMFWSIDNDDFRGTCHGKPYPLIEAAKEAYYSKLGSTINTIAQTTQTTPARSSSKRRQRPRVTTPSTTTTTSTTARTTTKTTSSSYNLRVTSTTPAWSINTPEPPTTPDPGSDFKCVDEGFYPHPRDCKKYFWCLDSGPSNLGIVAHQFTCPSGLYFNKAADSCDFARNVLCKKPATTTKAPTSAPLTTTSSTTTARTTTTTRRAFPSTRNSVLFRTTSVASTTPKPRIEDESDEVGVEDDAEDPKVIKELIDLIRKVGGIEQLEKQLHLSDQSSSVITDAVASTTQSSFNKKLYQKVLDRTRGQNRYTGNNIIESLTQTVQSGQNSRRGPQNAGLEPSKDIDRPLRNNRPQYVTINRQRGPATSTPATSEEDYDEEEEVKNEQTFRVKPVQAKETVATTAKTLQYVNIRRGRPNSVISSAADTADDTASRNALFERQESQSAISENANTVDVLSLRRETKPEYVTIRRQRPSTEETTTEQYQQSDEEEEDRGTTLLEREISTQPKYNVIVRTQSTPLSEEPSTRAPTFRIYTLQTDTPASPDPTTVLAVQISSLLNSLNSSEAVDTETETDVPIAETVEPVTTTTTTSTTTTTTTTPRATLLRRTTVARRRSTTIKTSPTTPAPSSTTQVSPRNYSIVRRRRPLSRPNEISSDSERSNDNDVSRKIRSTTPDSREVGGANGTGSRRFRSRLRVSQFRSDDSVPAAASPVISGQFNSNDDEDIVLTRVEVQPKFVPRQRNNLRTERLFARPSTSPTINSDTVPDSDVSAATVEARRPSLVTRGRNRFTLSSTTEATILSTNAATLTPRRPTFGRFSPRPFTRPPPSPEDFNEEVTVEAVTQRSTLRLPFGRTRPTPAVVARKLPFPSRQPTTQQTLVKSDNYEDEPETRVDDILLSESAREEKEHNEPETNLEEEVHKRRVIIKKLRASTTTEDVLVSTETVPIDTDSIDTGKRRFRVIRRRPSSSTTTAEPEISSDFPTGPGTHRIRKVIRKKIRPTEIESEISTKTIQPVNTFKSSTTEVLNYGERTKAPTTTTSTEAETEAILEEVTEFYKEENKVNFEAEGPIKEVTPELAIEEPLTEKVITTAQEKQEDKIIVETATTSIYNNNFAPTKVETLENITGKSEDIAMNKSTDEYSSNTNFRTDIRNVITTSKIEKNNEVNAKVQTKTEFEVAVATDEKAIDISSNKETETDSFVTETIAPETTTTSTTLSTTISSRTRLPYRPRKKLFTPTTESSVPSTSKTFSRKYNPGAYTSPATLEKPQFRPSSAVTRKPFSSKVFTRRPFTTKTTTKVEEEEEYTDEESEVEEHEEENPFVFVPAGQLFTRKPVLNEEDDDASNSEELLEEGEGDEHDEEEGEQGESKFPTTRKPGFRPRVVNSNTFRTSTSTTELPKRITTSQNRTAIITRFASNKPVTDKKRVQNVPSAYNTPVNAFTPNGEVFITVKNETLVHEYSEDNTTTSFSIDENETTDTDDDYLTATSITLTDGKDITFSYDISTTKSIDTQTVTDQMEIDDSTDDYLEFTEGTTNYPTTQDVTTLTQSEPELKTTTINNIVTNTIPNTETTIEQLPTVATTTLTPTMSPIIKTQFNKLFSISRVVEVNSKLDKHHLNKNNETTLIEEGQIMVEKKPEVHKIGEVSRYSLIKIVEDEIPIYLTKFGHIYPVENPPDNIIRIDETRNARALKESLPEVPKENLVASESINEGYRHIKEAIGSKNEEPKGHIEHVPNDQFLSYINDDKKNYKDSSSSLFDQWQFVPAAYENEKIRAGKNFDIITPRSMPTNPSTLPLEGLFRTDNPLMARKVNDEKNKPLVVYSASVQNQPDRNIDEVPVVKPENSRSIITFAKGQELSRASITEDATTKDSLYGPVYSGNYVSSPLYTPLFPLSNISSTTATVTTTVVENETSPILNLLSTTEIMKDVNLTTTESPATTTTHSLDTTTTKIPSRAKFPFARRPIIKSSNFTRPSIAPRTVKKINVTAASNLSDKINKTTFNPSKSRFSAIRTQNVPVDSKKKSTSLKVTPKVYSTSKKFTTETPRTTTERKVYIKSIRPNFRPGFLQRRTTPAATTGDT